MLDLAWQLWGELGVRGWSRDADPFPAAVEVEPLIAFTAHLVADDRRLEREVVSWVAKHSDLTSPRQFMNVVTAVRWPFQGEIDALGAKLSEATGRKWPSHSGGSVATSELSDRALVIDMSRPSTMQLRSRAVFGVVARAEVVRVLLQAGRPMGVAELDSRIAFTSRQIRIDLDGLERAGVVRDVSRPAAAAAYALVDPDAVARLIGPVGMLVPWAPSFRLLTALDRLVDEVSSAGWRAPAVEVTRQLRLLEDVIGDAAIEVFSAHGHEDLAVALSTHGARLIAALVEGRPDTKQGGRS